MAHPFKSAGHKNDPKWLGNVRKYADGGAVDDASAKPDNRWGQLKQGDPMIINTYGARNQTGSPTYDHFTLGGNYKSNKR